MSMKGCNRVSRQVVRAGRRGWSSARLAAGADACQPGLTLDELVLEIAETQDDDSSRVSLAGAPLPWPDT